MSRLPRRHVLVLAVACATALAVALPMACGLTTAPAAAADLSLFSAGEIISDTIFYDTSTMSVATLQAFLNARGSACTSSPGYTCLKDYTETTSGRDATSRCAAYPAGTAESAATIVWKVGQACGINPEVLVVTLQKEQALVTARSGKPASTYQKAMGFGCPDTAACDTQYYGFFNQVYSAASQFRSYALNPTRYSHVAGRVNAVQYSPNASCGSSQVYIVNQATASLYNYTPYQPNAAALAAGYGNGDSCSSYGNRNFWEYFTDWFGPTVDRTPIGSVDLVNSPVTGQIRVAGWALDPDTTSSITVHVYVDGSLASAFVASGDRPDVAAAFGKGAAHGFIQTIQASGGTHVVCVYGIDTAGGTNPLLGCSQVTVINQAPIGSYDLASVSRGVVTVGGWALDPDTTSSITVQIYVDGALSTSGLADRDRPDVAAVFGDGAAHGFLLSVPVGYGTHQVCVDAVDSSGAGSPAIGCKTVRSDDLAPIGWLDLAAARKDGVVVGGWALDPNTSSSIPVQVVLDGQVVANMSADGSRPDVAAAYSLGSAHGFDAVVPATTGVHTVCVQALDTWGGATAQVGCATVNVNAAPVGSVDLVSPAGTGALFAGGWAFDPNQPSTSIDVQVAVDGAVAATWHADGARPDVDAAYGISGQHGYSGVVSGLTAGKHAVCVYAVGIWTGAKQRLACTDVTTG